MPRIVWASRKSASITENVGNGRNVVVDYMFRLIDLVAKCQEGN